MLSTRRHLPRTRPLFETRADGRDRPIEAIEVHLNYLRTGFDTMQAALPVLRDKIDRLSEKLDAKIEALEAKMNARFGASEPSTHARISALEASTSQQFKETNARIDGAVTCLRNEIKETHARIDGAVTPLRTELKEANDKREAGDAALSDKIDKLTEISLKNQAQLKSIGWLLSIVSVIASAVSIARTLDWI